MTMLNRACSRPLLPARRRLSPDERRRHILEGALDFFAERGFAADTRALAEHLGVAQSLIFHHFPTKEALVEAVFQRNFLARWDEKWEVLLRDTARPLSERLVEFYSAYLHAVDEPRWIRIAMHASLSGNDLTQRYVNRYANRILEIVAEELAATRAESTAPTESDREAGWLLHSAVIYYLVRKHIHRTRVAPSLVPMLPRMVETFLSGALSIHPGA